MAGIFAIAVGAIGSVIKFPFRAIVFLLGWTSSLIVRILLVLALLISVPLAAVAAYLIVDYQKNSYRYQYTSKCDLRSALFPGIQFDFEYSCVDATKFNDSRYVNFVFFMSSEDNPSPGRTGHGWLALIRLSKAEQSVLLHDWQVFGFWGDNNFNCSSLTVSVYSMLAPWLPFRQLIEQNYKAFCMGGVSGLESQNVVASAAGVPFPSITSLNDIHIFLGRRPSQVFAVAIDGEQFNNVRWIASESSKRSYTVLLSDCTTLLYRIASAMGLYTPPRFMYPFPSNSVEAFRRFNTR